MGETVVVGYDGQERSDRALERAIETVKSDGGKLIVVVVEEFDLAQHPSPVGLGYPDPEILGFGPMSSADLEHPLPGVQEIIDRAWERLDGAGVSGECTWGLGDPAQVILDAAREHSASRIMLGAHHHGFFGRLFGDDVDAGVKREARCEVVLVE
jgi:nucleotide-binding universal stress UspA family protein